MSPGRRDEGLHRGGGAEAARAGGKEINYEGASGPCDFTDIGDIKDCKFRFQGVENGKFKLLEVQSERDVLTTLVRSWC